jgi:hypothetical protein
LLEVHCAPPKVPGRFDQVKREAGALFLRSILIAGIRKRPCVVAVFDKAGAAPATVGKSNLID